MNNLRQAKKLKMFTQNLTLKKLNLEERFQWGIFNMAKQF